MVAEIKKAYFIAKKDMGAYYLKPPLISLGLMFPIVFVLAFYSRNPTGIKEVVPGLIGLTLLFSCTSMAAMVITFEKRIGALEKLLLAPLNIRTILKGGWIETLSIEESRSYLMALESNDFSGICYFVICGFTGHP